MTFHRGERDLQRRAGVEKMADRVGRIIQDFIPEDAAEFLAEQRQLWIGHRDDAGRVRASLVTGRPGFARAVDPRAVDVDGPSFPAGEAGALALDFAARSRLRLNGRLESRPGGFRIAAREVYGNCPKYIQAREIVGERPAVGAPLRRSAALLPDQRDLIARSDTLFIATVPPGEPADVSHRGGNPGFVRIPDDRHLSWDDYSGNAMFNTLGNLQLDPEAGLLFVGFDDGRLLHVNGQAVVIGDRERRVDFEIREVLEAAGGHPFRWSPPDYSPFNPR
ncbi:MAG: pyridoxamine 5'-phosphate oxidase family protein [Planctomycetaceae bacterium]|nr:pyridoxamine 5'-phosphate oxidase family protein [Planctomycetaceae bacterium]